MKNNYMVSVVCTVFIGTLFLSGCRSIKILDVPLISMTKEAVPEPQKIKLKSIGSVQGEFCAGMFEVREIGLIDSVVKKVQKQYKVDYIKDAYITMTGSNCLQLAGEGIKIQQHQQQKQKSKRSAKHH